MSEWLSTPRADTPEDGYEVAVKKTQPDADAREVLRAEYANDPDALIAVSHMVAANYATTATAKDHGRTS